MDFSSLPDQDIVEELCDIEEGLNEWEVGFVEDMAKRVLDGGLFMTPNMRAKAEEILDGQRDRL